MSTHPGFPDRPSVLFVHGVYHGSWAFEDFRLPFTEAGYPVALLDLRGHVGEDRLTPRSDVGYADYLEDVHRALDGIPGRKVVVGHSLGGLLAISAMARPDLDAIVILAAPLPSAVRRAQWRLLFEFPVQTIRFLLNGDASAIYHDERFTDRYVFSDHTPGSVKADAVARIRRQHEPARLFREIRSMDFSPVSGSVPALVVVAAEDPTVTAGVGAELRRLTGGEVMVVPDAGHDLILEPSSRDVAGAILGWMGGHAPS